AAAGAGWDLVIVDEAHHLRGAKAYEVAQGLSRRTWGLLLLTATPLQLDPAEYHALLRLVDPAPAATEQELRARLARQGDLSAQVRALLAGDASAAERVAKLFPDDAGARETIDYLKAALARRRIEALAYVGALSPAERDKLVARFRDPDGPRVLLSTELGGEGRNFQHCHVLVNYDLAWSPAAIEQRIGRIDRIGQSREVRIFALRPEGTLAARVLDVLDGAVGVFTEPVGGLDPVLEGVEPSLLALASTDDAERWEEMTRKLAARVSAARAEVARAYDPLLDLRSCDFASVRALAERGGQRIGARLSPTADAEAGLRMVATLLESRLEAVTIEAA